MSSAILYVAIVAIWIGVLVPRWLRHDNTRDGQTRLRRFSRHKDTRDTAEWAEDAEPGAVPEPSGAGRTFGAYLGAPVAEAGTAPSYEPATEVPPVPSYGWSAEEYLRHERAAQRGDGEGRAAERSTPGRDEGPARPRDPRDPRGGEPPARHPAERSAPQRGDRQARMVMARRRMLMMLVVLTLAALGLAVLQLAAGWVVIPPTLMLLGYLMLLREAARADAELRQHRAAERAASAARRARDAERATGAGRGAEAGSAPAADGFAPVWPAHEPLSNAEVIDISARVGDQLYDQYADAKLRAVGD